MLIALVARVDAAPSDDSIALAARYADLLTGIDDPEDSDKPNEADETDGAADTSEAVDRDAAIDTAEAHDAAEARDTDEVRDTGEVNGVAVVSDTEPSAPDARHPTTPNEDANVAGSQAGAVETYESWTRRAKPSRWGRLDLGLAWRRHWSEPMHTLPQRRDEVWLVATWRR